MSDENEITKGSGSEDGTDDQVPPKKSTLNPNDFMRERRPELFSDTQVDSAPQINKEVFEYHLETLTNRKQEIEFEHFCRKLAEKEICPNLRLQTGPTGGGDSKVDSESYPVAEKIAERWWIGSPSSAAERWAFAFSAKKDWKSKVKDDVKSIWSTGRDYKLIYFISNQFAPDKVRASCEDALSKETGVPVHILDRSWIVEKVLASNKRQLETYLAALRIDNVQEEMRSRPGPRDTARLEELEELDRQIDDSSRYVGARYQLVEDFLRTALLARGLERARTEVEGRFVRAESLARDSSHNQQRLRIAYNRAWTAFVWYEDFGEFNRIYDEVEEYARASAQVHDVDLLLNLWILLLPSITNGWIEEQAAKIEARSLNLKVMLETLLADSSRPSTALQARTGLILMQNAQARDHGKFEEVEKSWCDLAEVVDESDGLVDYPVERISKLVGELGVYCDSPAFDALYDRLASAMKLRQSDGAAGISYGKRAQQKIGLEKPYEAIQWAGKAEELLAKEEYREEFTFTLILASYAYECVGLLWAARNKALAAVERTLGPLVKEGILPPLAKLAVNRLTWIEIKLGRIPHSLDAIVLARSIAPLLDLSDTQQEAYAKQLEMQELAFSIHFLNLPMKALPELTRLPGTLERLGLHYARIALLFALGHEQVLRDEGYIPQSNDSEAIQRIFEQWHDQPATEDIAPQPMLIVGKISRMKSTILGVELVVQTPNSATSFSVAESLLGALEAFLATSDEQFVLPHLERITIVISSSNQLQGVPQISFSENNSDRVEVLHPEKLDFANVCEQQAYLDWLQNSIVKISCRFLIIKDVEKWLEQVAGQERGLSRAMAFGNTLTLHKNVFGETPRIRLVDWLVRSDKSYGVLRKKKWMVKKAAGTDGTKELRKPGSASPRCEVLDKEQIKHTDRRILSPIDAPLWEKANWRATLFACASDGPPILAFAFEDGRAGESIFRAWNNQWGGKFQDDVLRIAVIRGLSKRNPAEYAITVGPNTRRMAGNEKRFTLILSRINRMSPKTSTHLENFVESYNKIGSFLLAPARINEDGQVSEMPSFQFAIAKRRLELREAWQIGENDPDIGALDEDDDPIIPRGVVDPPINEAMKQIRALREPRS